MDIDLETCLVGFLIGVAIYLLLNRVFNKEGIDNVQSQSQSPPPIDCDNQPENLCPSSTKQTGCLDTYNRAWSCNVERAGCKGEHQIWCDNYPGQSPSQSPSQSPGQSPGQSPSQSPGQSPGQSTISGDEFIEYLDFDFTNNTFSINWDKLETDNNTLYSRIKCLIRLGRNVFSEPSNKITGVTDLKITSNIADPFEFGYGKKRFALPFVVELFKFIDLTKLKGLKSDTGITGDISVFNKEVFPSLSELDLSNTGIYGDISVFNKEVFPSLTVLDLSNTGITGDISVFNKEVFPSLTVLDLSNTGITGDINQFYAPPFFNISHNSIHGDINKIKIHRYQYYINLSHNTDITGDIGIFLKDIFSFHSALENINLSNTGITGDINVLDNNVFNTLQILKLNDTDITGDISLILNNKHDYTPITNAIRELDLSNTRITGDVGKLTNAYFISLEFLDVSNTRINKSYTKNDQYKCVKL